MENTEAKIYYVQEDCIHTSRRFFARQLVKSTKPLMPPFVEYNPAKHGKRPDPFDMDLWTGQAGGS